MAVQLNVTDNDSVGLTQKNGYLGNHGMFPVFRGDRHDLATPTNVRRHARTRFGRTYPANLHRKRCRIGNILPPNPRRPDFGIGRSLVTASDSRPQTVL